MPELIYEGHVYVAMPPLYKAMPKKGEEEYLYDDKALERYRKTHSDFTLQRYKGLGEMDAEQLWETTLNPETRMMKRIEIEDARMASGVTEMLMGTDCLLYTSSLLRWKSLRNQRNFQFSQQDCRNGSQYDLHKQWSSALQSIFSGRLPEVQRRTADRSYREQLRLF